MAVSRSLVLSEEAARWGFFKTPQSPSQWLSAALRLMSIENYIAQHPGQLENDFRDESQIEKRIDIRVYTNFVNPYFVSVVSVI